MRALDAAGNVSDFSNSARPPSPRPTPSRPGAPGNLTAVQTSTDHVDLTWDAATDNVGVTGYRVYRDGAAARDARRDDVSHGRHAWRPATSQLRGEGRWTQPANLSEPSNTAEITVIDTQTPRPPQANLTATAVGSSRIDLAWEASNDNVGVTGYEIYRDDSPLTTIGPSTT